jgi:hypothetical protein
MSRRTLASGLAALAAAFVAALALIPDQIWPEYSEASRRLAGLVARAEARGPLTDPELRLAALALVAQEDRRLFDRSLPIDLRSCGRAAVVNLTAQRTEGCSTLPMQLAKATLPDALAAERSWRRKLIQTRLAVGLSFTSPETVLSAYLEALPCGSNIARGLEACALLRFGVGPEALTAPQAVALMTAVPAPSRELNDIDRARARVHRSLSAAVALGWVPAARAAEVVRAPLELPPLHPDAVRAVARGWDLGLTRQLELAVEAARENVWRKQGGSDDLLVFGALLSPSGQVRAFAGANPSWLERRFEAGSWVKPFCAEALRSTAGLGEPYLEGASIPLRLPLYDRNLRRYRPRNASERLPSHAVPADWILQSVNTATLATMIFAPMYMGGPDRDRWLDTHLSAAERERYRSATDMRLTRELASAYAGFPLSQEEVAGFPGYRALSLAGTRACLAQMRTRVPNLEVPREDLGALLGVVRAPIGELARGLADLWLQDGQPTPVAKLMARHASSGTLGWAVERLGGPFIYKTATAERNAMLAAVVEGPDGPLLLVLAAVRPSGKPIHPVQGGTMGPGLLALAEQGHTPARTGQ